MKSKLIFSIIFGIIFLFGIISSVNATLDVISTGYAGGGTGAENGGIRFQSKSDLTSIKGIVEGTATKLKLLDSSGALLNSTTLSGGNGTIVYNIVAMTEYMLVADKDGVAYDYKLGDEGLPKNGTLFNFLFPIFNSANYAPQPTYGFNILAMEGTPDTQINYEIEILSPANNSIIISTGANFSANFTISGDNPGVHVWKNATYYVWHSNGTLLNATTVSLSGNQTNETLFIDDFTIGDYLWNVNGCYGNVSFSNCTWSSNGNFSFEYRPFSLDAQSYSEFIYETSSQTYRANITTIPSILNVISRLNYNGTQKTATTICSAGVCQIVSTFDIPLINVESTNVTVYWNITVYDGTNSYSFTTEESSFEQNVSRIHLELCNANYTTQTLNFTSWNEKNLSRINPYSFAGTFYTWLGSGTVMRNQSFQNTSVGEMRLCITPNLTTYTNAQIRYSFDNENATYITRDYYFDNASISNSSQDIKLYLLEAEDSTTFIVKVQDQKLSSVQDSFVYIQRFYPEDGLYRTVQIAKTDSNGETVGFYEVEIADYRHLIIKNGETLLETFPQKVVGKEVPFTLTFTVGSALNYPWSVFESDPNIITSLNYNQSTKIVSFTYIDSTGSTTLGRLLVQELSRSNSTISTICNSSSSESSATITCNMSSYEEGNFIAYGYIESEVSDVYDFLINTAREILDRTGLLIGMFIILTSGFAFIWNPTAGVVGVEAALIFVNLIGLVTFSPIFIFASVAIAILALILLRS